MHIVFAGGGAAGNWFPGLTVAHQVRAARRSARVTFLGAGKDFESRNATIAGFQYVPMWNGNLAAGLGRAWRYFTDDLAAHRAAKRFLRRERPQVVVGLNGHACVPAIRAAMAMDIPVVLLDYNALPSAVTRKYADRTAVVCAGFAAAREHLEAAAPIRIVGNPIRAGFSQVFRLRGQALKAATRNPLASAAGARQLVVLAGTAGDGEAINESVPKALYKLRSELAGWRIVHQSGSRQLAATRLLYSKLGLAAEVTAFIPDMPRVLLAANMAVSRPGGITLSELAAATVPSVVLPSDKASERHQAANSAAFAEHGACRVVEEGGERRLDDRVCDALHDLLVDSAARARMSAAMAELARPNAAWHVAKMVLDLAQHSALQNVA